jgi:hypothetical protein
VFLHIVKAVSQLKIKKSFLKVNYCGLVASLYRVDFSHAAFVLNLYK